MEFTSTRGLRAEGSMKSLFACVQQTFFCSGEVHVLEIRICYCLSATDSQHESCSNFLWSYDHQMSRICCDWNRLPHPSLIASQVLIFHSAICHLAKMQSLEDDSLLRHSKISTKLPGMKIFTDLLTRVDPTWKPYTAQFMDHTIPYKKKTVNDFAMTFMATILWLAWLP